MFSFRLSNIYWALAMFIEICINTVIYQRYNHQIPWQPRAVRILEEVSQTQKEPRHNQAHWECLPSWRQTDFKFFKGAWLQKELFNILKNHKRKLKAVSYVHFDQYTVQAITNKTSYGINAKQCLNCQMELFVNWYWVITQTIPLTLMSHFICKWVIMNCNN